MHAAVKRRVIRRSETQFEALITLLFVFACHVHLLGRSVGVMRDSGEKTLTPVIASLVLDAVWAPKPRTVKPQRVKVVFAANIKWFLSWFWATENNLALLSAGYVAASYVPALRLVIFLFFQADIFESFVLLLQRRMGKAPPNAGIFSYYRVVRLYYQDLADNRNQHQWGPSNSYFVWWTSVLHPAGPHQGLYERANSYSKGRWTLEGLVEITKTARMKFKPPKSRILVLRRGRVRDCFHFKISEDVIPTVWAGSTDLKGRGSTSRMRHSSILTGPQLSKSVRQNSGHTLISRDRSAFISLHESVGHDQIFRQVRPCVRQSKTRKRRNIRS